MYNVMSEPVETTDSLTFSSGFLYVLLAASALVDAYIVSVVCLLYILYYLISSGLSLPRDLMRYAVIPLLLILIGLAGSSGNERYDVLKDGWYYLNPFLVLCTGYLAMNKVRKLEPILNAFLVVGTLLSLYYLAKVFYNIPFFINASVEELHQAKGGGYLLTVLSLAIMLLANRWGIGVNLIGRKKTTNYFIIIVNTAALLLYFYRTHLLAFAILYLFGAGWFMRRKLRWLFLLVAVLAAFQIMVLLVPKEYINTSTMLGKLANSLDEIVITDYYAKAEIQRHWRGYESYWALQAYLDGNVLNLIAGHGFGKLVDLKLVMQMGKEKMRFIPIFHNGYMYLLVKTGLFGVMLYFTYLAIFIRDGFQHIHVDDPGLLFAGYLIIALSVSLLVTTFVAAGMFNKTMFFPAMLLLGCLLSYGKIRRMETLQL